MNLRRATIFILASVLVAPTGSSQTSATPTAASARTAVPPLVPYSGVAFASDGKPIAGDSSITFLIYKEESGGEPLWAESQTVAVDPAGHYQVQLGAGSPNGLPGDLFSTGEARWLEVQIGGQAAETRVLLASVPYALKAGDAATLGGLPVSAFVLARTNAAPSNGVAVPAGATPNTDSVTPNAVSNVTTTGGTSGYVPVFSGSATIAGSPVFTLGSDVGIGTTTPRSPLEIQASAYQALGPALTLTNTLGGMGAESALDFNTTQPSTKGTYNPMARIVAQDADSYSDSLLFQSNNPKPSAQNSGLLTNMIITSTGLVGIGTTTPSSQLQVNGTVTATSFSGSGSGLTGVTASNATELGGLASSAYAKVGAANTFTANQTVNGTVTATSFAGNGSGLTGVTAANSAKLGGYPSSAYAGLGAANVFAANQFITGNLTASGTVKAATVNATDGFNLGGSPFLFGSFDYQSVYVGSAGNATTAAYSNTATGFSALNSNTTGGGNTADGSAALISNTTGQENTAVGVEALQDNETGQLNVAVGWFAGSTTDDTAGVGSNNTAVGSNTFFGSLISNATVIGANAQATESNTLVLGCVAGTIVYDVNVCPTGVSVGIGTTTPDSLLTVNGTADKPGGGSWGTYSDIRLKTVSGGFSGGLEQVMQLRPIRYRYKADNAMGIRDAEEHVGVVAQEVRRVIPEAVTENSKGYLIVNNDPVIWSMVNAIKEQQKEIEEQRKLIREQSRAMRSLVAEVRETRKALRLVKGQAGSAQVTMVAAK